MSVKKLLKSHRYPPEGMDDAVQTVLTQCELWTDNEEYEHSSNTTAAEDGNPKEEERFSPAGANPQNVNKAEPEKTDRITKELKSPVNEKPKKTDSPATQQTVHAETEYQLWEKQPLRIPRNQERTCKKFDSIFDFQDEYPSDEEKAAKIQSMHGFEVDELINKASNVRMKNFLASNKKKELIFSYRSYPWDDAYSIQAPNVSIFDGSDDAACVEYQLPGEDKKSIGLKGKDIRRIKAAMHDNLLFETDMLEAPYQMFVLDGTYYKFYLSLKGRENFLTGSNIKFCRKDYEHCIHAAHMIDTLEQIRDILVPHGVPAACFSLTDEDDYEPEVAEEETEEKKPENLALRKKVESMCRKTINKYGVAIVWTVIDPDYEKFFRERFDLKTDEDYITFVKHYLKAIENNYNHKDYFDMRQTAEKCIEEVISHYQFTEEKKQDTIKLFIAFFLRNLIQDRIEIADRENYKGKIPEVADDDIDVLDLADFFACAHIGEDYVKQAEFLETVGVTFEYDQPHMVCWFSGQITLGSGNYSRTVPNYSSKVTYNRLNNPYSLLWIATVLGEDFHTIRETADEMNQKNNLTAMSGIVRKRIPFSRIFELYNATCEEDEGNS